LAVLREAVAAGVNHIDTSDFYGPHVINQLIREALHPYPENLVIVTKVSARRGKDGSWIPAFSREELTQAVHDNLRNLDLDVLEIVNLRAMFDVHEPAEGSIEAPLTVLAELQQQGVCDNYRYRMVAHLEGPLDSSRSGLSSGLVFAKRKVPRFVSGGLAMENGCEPQACFRLRRMATKPKAKALMIAA